MSRSTNWCFTINNPSIDDILQLDWENKQQWNNQIVFAVYAKEYGTNMTEHYQGYLETAHPKTLSWLKKRLPRAHFESRKGTRNQAILYCLKEYDTSSTTTGTQDVFFWELYPHWITWQAMKQELTSYKTSGKTSNSGTLTRKQCLQQMKTMIDEGKTDVDLANFDFNTYVSCFRGLNQYRLIITPPRNHETKVIVCQGPTGTGKSKWCMDNYPNAYWKQRGNWWDNYSGQETVIIDEFYGWLPYDLILRLCDRYPLMVEVKGGQVQFIAKTIIFTSNQLPERWYKNVYFSSFTRRVHEWHIFPIWGEHEIHTDYNIAISKMVDNY